MSTIHLHLPDSIYDKVKEIALRDGISVDQFLASAAAEKVAAFMGGEYLEQRARRGSKEAFERALAEVPDVPADPGDEI